MAFTQQQRSAPGAPRSSEGSVSLVEFWGRIDPRPELEKDGGETRRRVIAGRPS